MKWTTKEGKKISVKQMTNNHLLNTIRFLERKAGNDLSEEIRSAWSALSGLQGEMAQFYCEQDIDRLESTGVEEWLENTCPIYKQLVKEAESRKLL